MVRLIAAQLVLGFLAGCAPGPEYEELSPHEMQRLAHECYNQGLRAVWVRKLGTWTVECRTPEQINE